MRIFFTILLALLVPSETFAASAQTPAVAKTESAKLVNKVGKSLSDPKGMISKLKQQQAVERRDIRDLIAQEDMAKWAYWMLIVAAFGTALSLLGILLVWRTLHHTRRAADFSGVALQEARFATAAAVTASEAATEANIILKETTDSQLRAYVGPESITYTYNAETGAFAVTSILKNFGQTPAYRYRTLVGLNFIPFPISEIPEVTGFQENNHTLFPSMTTQSTILLPAGRERAFEIAQRRACFFMTIICEYEDHAGEKHSEKTLCYVTGPQNSTQWNGTHTASMTFHSGKTERGK